MSGDGLHLDNGVVMWYKTIEYLGIHFKCGKRLQVDIDPIRRRFYAASNCIFMNASNQDQLRLTSVALTLLTYCHGALSLSNAQLSDLNVCWNNLYRKSFHFHRLESVRVFVCQMHLTDYLITLVSVCPCVCVSVHRSVVERYVRNSLPIVTKFCMPLRNVVVSNAIVSGTNRK